MTKEDRDLVYRELADMHVTLAMVPGPPQAGFEYFKERMMQCRRLQDRASDLAVMLGRELSRLRQTLRAVRVSLKLIAQREAQADRLTLEARTLEDEFDELKALVEAVENRRGNLRQTGSDIRLMVSVIDTQIRLGEVVPPVDTDEGTVTAVLADLPDDLVPIRETVVLTTTAEAVDIGDLLAGVQ